MKRKNYFIPEKFTVPKKQVVNNIVYDYVKNKWYYGVIVFWDCLLFCLHFAYKKGQKKLKKHRNKKGY